MFTRIIDKVTYIDMERLWMSLNNLPAADRLATLLKNAGVSFFDDKNIFVKKPVVAVTGFGGFPVSFNETTTQKEIVINRRSAAPADHLAEMQKTRGFAGMITNLNTGNHNPVDMDGLTTQLSHMSKLRANTVTLHIFGYPAAIEANFMRLYKYATHVGCLTVTRNAAQANPPWVVLDPAHLDAARELRERLSIAARPADKNADLKDFQEGMFGLHPKNAAMALMLDIDLRNLSGTMGDIADAGQETAWRRILALINDQMHALFPAFFQPTASYHYRHPAHWD